MRIVQISDLHLWTLAADPRTVRYLDNAAEHPTTDTIGSLHAVLDNLEAVCPGGFSRVDKLVITGDIAQDEQKETYWLLRRILSERGLLDLALCIPGNHEHRPYLREVFGGSGSAECHGGFSDAVCGWRLVGVDTHDTDAKVGWDGEMAHLHDWGGGTGRLRHAQLQWLEEELRQHRDQPTVVFIHHPPTPVPGSPWLDSVLIEQPGQAELERILARSPQVRAVHCGESSCHRQSGATARACPE
eukprot:COSAG03_NODE_2396_length_2812_cov_2.107630_2_plen_244_part_00